jgi:two-component system sensor histidine kinase PilS (NtrC family)
MPRAVDEPELTWRVLETLNLFRLLIAFALLGLFFARSNPRFFGDSYPTLFAATAAGYLVFAALLAVLLRQRWATVGAVGPAQVLVDIIAVVVLMHASGGISSGLGGLLVVFVGAGSLILPFQYPAIMAATATFAILGEQAFSQFSGLESETNFPAAGLLSAIVFAMALAAQPLARRIRASEALVRKFGVDLQNVSELNEYIVQHLRESIVVVDADDTIRLINSSATQLLGADNPLSGSPLSDTSGALQDYVKLWREDTTRSSHPEFTLVTEGNAVRITAHMAPLGKDGQRAGPILIFLEDVSIMKARVQQSKLASLGRLSASIAHEIRNPVGAMSHAAQLLGESRGLTADDVRLTEIIQTHSERVSHIIDNVLQLSRRETSQPLRFSLKSWLFVESL